MICAGCDDCAFDVTKGTMTNFYEAHITVDHLGLAEDAFEGDCFLFGVKPLVMVGNGLHQYMCTVKIEGDLGMARNRAQEVADAFIAEGYDIERVKIESHPAGSETPSRNNLKKLSDGQYFEAHIDVDTHEGGLEALKVVAKMNGLWISFNNLKYPDAEGYRTYIATLRRHDGTIEGFRTLVNDAARHMRMRGLEVIRIIEEFCVYDSNEALDAEWITA